IRDFHVTGVQTCALPISILRVAFNRPRRRNALTWEMYDALLAVCHQVEADPGVRVLVLRGAGGEAFVSGTDIAQFAEFASGEDEIGRAASREGVEFIGVS